VDNVLWAEFNMFIANVKMSRRWEKKVELIYFKEVTAYFDEHRILHAHAVYEFSMLFYKII
jgi:hypothetical protein